MRRVITIIASFAATGLMSAYLHVAYAEDEFCADEICKQIEEKYFKREYAEIVSLANSKENYSEGARFYIGMSHIVLAEKSASLEEKEKLYRQAILLKYYPAYMSLYDMYRKKEPKKAEELLREYVKTGPSEPAPFVALGNIEFDKRAYKEADRYLRRAKKLLTKHTAEVDWLLFKTNYVLGNYEFAARMFSSALAQSRLADEIFSIRTDSRFVGIEERPEFKQYKDLLTKSNEH